jgi:hypothetical protein
MVWLFTRPIRLEITQTQVRAFHGSVIKKAATTAGKAIYKASGIQSIVSCVTNPNLASCVRAAVTVVGLALTIATGGAGAVVDAGVDAAADAATDAAADAATDAATDSAADATEDVTDTEGGGGLKETAGTWGIRYSPLEQTGQDCGWGSVLPQAASAISQMEVCPPAVQSG